MTESIGKTFWQNTRMGFVPQSPQSRGEPQPPLELPYDPAAELIHLVEPAQLMLPPASLWEVMTKRATLRRYSPEPPHIERTLGSVVVYPRRQRSDQSPGYPAHRAIGGRTSCF